MSFIKKANKIKQAYDEIVQQYGEPVTAQKVLEYATPKDSILHEYFEWDGEKAAHQYRIWQARKLLSELEIVVGSYTIRETMNIPVPIGTEGERGYWNAATVASNKELREQALAQMRKEAYTFFNRWKAYEEVFKILNKESITEIEREFTTVA